MKTTALISLTLACGCSQYMQVQTDLIDQARKGVAMTSNSLESKSQLVQQLHTMQRKRLDEAFDLDVREHAGALSAEWVIEHRRAYAVGIDALNEQLRATERSAENEQRTIDGIDRALQQLRWFQSLQSRWMLLTRDAQP